MPVRETSRIAALLVAFTVLAGTNSSYSQTPKAYYVAVGGDDGANGSIKTPFATLGHAVGIVAAGDTVFVRGGTFESPATIRIDQSGADSTYLHVFAYPGEQPIFDFTGTDRDGIDIRGSFVHVNGLILQNAGHSGLFIKGGSWNIIENVETRYNRNSGLQVEDGASNNLILNTDSYENYDPAAGGENADGFAIKFDVGPGNILRGCRSWGNSDDGYDFWEANEGVTVEGSWAFRNGVNIWEDPNFMGDSNGFKLGHGAGAHRLIRNLAWNHLKHGFDVNGNTTGVTLYNNTAFQNEGRNFYFDENNSAHVLRNNISLAGDVLMLEAIDDSSNSWNGFNVGGADFLSLNDAGADDPRNPDGSLPDLTFLHLASGSKVIDAGVDVGIPFDGSAPDLGAFETKATGVASETESPDSATPGLANFPNPFVDATTFLMSLPNPEEVQLVIFDVNGRHVATVYDGLLGAGEAAVRWDIEGRRLPPGVYFARMSAADFQRVMPIVLGSWK